MDFADKIRKLETLANRGSGPEAETARRLADKLRAVYNQSDARHEAEKLRDEEEKLHVVIKSILRNQIIYIRHNLWMNYHGFKDTTIIPRSSQHNDPNSAFYDRNSRKWQLIVKNTSNHEVSAHWYDIDGDKQVCLYYSSPKNGILSLTTIDTNEATSWIAENLKLPLVLT